MIVCYNAALVFCPEPFSTIVALATTNATCERREASSPLRAAASTGGHLVPKERINLPYNRTF